jgi:hypothetical protein
LISTRGTQKIQLNESEYGTKDENGILWFDRNEVEDAYNWMIDNWHEGMGEEPTYEDFYAWLIDNTNKEGKYRMPIGDIVPLILIALAYMVMMFVRKR